jgi:5-methylcytosine-specific restriction endonuclease McrA
MKTCSGCREDKPIDAFRFRADKRLYVTKCKVCESAAQAVYYQRLKTDLPRYRAQTIRSGRSKNVTRRWLDAKLKEQRFRCALSGRPIDYASVEVDHIVPRCKGGGDELSNLQLVCREANAAKGSLSNDELAILCEDIARTIGRAILTAEAAHAA